MPNFNRGATLGRRSGTVTVIEEPVRRSAARTAKIASRVTFLAVAALATPVAASRWHPIIALFAGVLAGLAAALLVGVVLLAWPVIRAIWWWSAEIVTAIVLVAGWVELAEHTTLPFRIGAVVLAVGVPTVLTPVRHWIIAVAWCAITRHRLRTCFSEFIITNRTGSLPLILWARPTPAGVRVWIWLRPGLALDDVEGRLDLIAVACWAASATVEAASATNSARIRLDLKRRDALTAPVDSPLLGVVTPAPDIERDTLPVPTALDLPDVAAADVAPVRAARKEPRTPAPIPAIKPVPATGPVDDIEDWI